MTCHHRTCQAAITIPVVIGIVILVFLMGISGSFQVSSSRKALETIHARRLLFSVASSAFEEAAARVEARPDLQQIPVPAGPRNLARDVLSGKGFPLSVGPVLTRADHASEGIEVSDVTVRTGDWKLITAADGPDRVIQEFGLFELEVALEIPSGSTTLRRTVRARRYAEASPDPGGRLCRIKLQHNNMVMLIED